MEKQDGGLLGLVIVCSHHHGNTEKVASAMARVLGGHPRRPREVDSTDLARADLVGFGSGIDGDKHYREIVELVDSLEQVDGKKAFIFSTCGAPARLCGGDYIARYARRSHAALRRSLGSKGYTIVGEFSCPGYNTNSFLGLVGGVNRGRPDGDDLQRAEVFVGTLGGKTP